MRFESNLCTGPCPSELIRATDFFFKKKVLSVLVTAPSAAPRSLRQQLQQSKNQGNANTSVEFYWKEEKKTQSVMWLNYGYRFRRNPQTSRRPPARGFSTPQDFFFFCEQGGPPQVRFYGLSNNAFFFSSICLNKGTISLVGRYF